MHPQLAALIVHDLKNALGTLENQLEELSMHPDTMLASKAHAHCVELREKMIGFLTLYKASEQGLTPHIEAVNPERFLHEVARNHATHRPDVRLIIDNTAMPDIAFFDEHLVGLALDAALQNATRFATSRIELGCVQTGGNTVFTIRDDGPGLGTKEETVSTGLGMALCAAIAHAHQNDARHGSADLVTSSEGGALFSLRLP